MKFSVLQRLLKLFFVAPLAGAWIEMFYPGVFYQSVLSSLPLRERGLKSEGGWAKNEEMMSLPLRERGLKYGELRIYVQNLKVAPLAGAWIEIGVSVAFAIFFGVAPLAGAWIEILLKFRRGA